MLVTDLVRDAVRLVVLQELIDLEAAERIGSARYEDPVGRVTTDHGCGCCPFRRGLASDDRRHPNRDKYVGKHDT